MNFENINGLLFAQNIRILENNMIFIVSTLLASFGVGVASHKYFIKFLGSLQ